jgi:hypothetical protein
MLRITTIRSLAVAALLLMQLAFAQLAFAQVDAVSIEGSWQGSMMVDSEDQNLALTFTKTESGYSATLINSGLGIYGMPADHVRVDGISVLVRFNRLDVEFLGTLRLDEAGEEILRIDGDWFEGAEMVQVILRAVENPSF